MIFLTVGSELPFDRLVMAVDTWCGANKQHTVFGQIADPGPNGYRPDNFIWKKFVSPDEYKQKYNEAELIIGHAGMGSIISALVEGRPILIMPRRASLRETRNDHQVATAKRFFKHVGIFVADEESMVVPMLNKWNNQKNDMSLRSASPYAEEKLINTIRDFICPPTKQRNSKH